MKFTFSLEDQVEVRPIRLSDSQNFFNMLDENRDAFSRAFTWLEEITSLREVEAFIEQAKQQAQDQRGLWCIILHTGTLAGVIAINNIDWRNSHCELGYGLAPSHRRQGILTRACQALLNYCFGELELHRVQIHVDTFNTRGRAVPERLGFTLEGVLEEAYATPDGFSDLAVYRMLEEEWRQRSPAKN